MNLLLRPQEGGDLACGRRHKLSFGEVFVSVSVHSRRSHEKGPMFDARALVFERSDFPGIKTDHQKFSDAKWACRLEFKTSASKIGELLDVTSEFLRRKLGEPVTILAPIDDRQK